MARFPISLAETAGLEGFKNAQGFFHGTADVEAVNNLVLENTIGIDDEKTAQGDNTTSLTEKQIGVPERIYGKHFSG